MLLGALDDCEDMEQSGRVPRLSLTELIEGRVTEPEVRVDLDDQVLAVDVVGDWAAVFRFSLSSSGEAHAETETAHRNRDGRWEERSSGGSRYARWAVPWTRPQDGWSDGHLLDLGHSGMGGVELDDGSECDVIAICGFASGNSDRIRVHGEGYERGIEPSGTGAFVVVALGRGSDYVTLIPMGEGVQLSRSLSFPHL